MFSPPRKQIIVDKKGRWKQRIIRRILKGIKPVCLSAISPKARRELFYFLYRNNDIVILNVDLKPYYLKDGKEVKRLVVEVA